MKTVLEYINEAKDVYTIKGVKVKEGEFVWVTDPKYPDYDMCVQVYLVNGSHIVYQKNGEMAGKVPIANFIETDKMAKAREKAENKLSGRKPGNTTALRKELAKLQDQLDDLYYDMENDPEVAEIAKRGDEPVEYSKQMNKIVAKIEKLRDKIQEIEHPGKTIKWKSFDSYLKADPKEGEDYEWVPTK